jgi:hypothetical protein
MKYSDTDLVPTSLTGSGATEERKGHNGSLLPEYNLPLLFYAVGLTRADGDDLLETRHSQAR